MEFNLCAMAITVLSFIFCITDFITFSSVKLSIADVASSKMTSSESSNHKRANASLCFSPPDKQVPFSPISVFKPSARFSTK